MTGPGIQWVSWELDSLPDLRALGARPGGFLWQREAIAVAGVGTALHLRLAGGLADDDAVAEAEAAVADIPPASRRDQAERLAGPVAVGALPYNRRAPAELVVPEVTVRAEGDRAWLTVVRPAGTLPTDPAAIVAAASAGADTRPAPDGFELSTTTPHEKFRRLVADTVATIRRGELDKVVLARRVDVAANQPFVLPDVAERLTALYPACTIFHADGYLGASPELLIERAGDQVHCLPLAGTVARSGDETSDRRLVDQLVGSAKEQAEHRFVIDTLTAALGPCCAELTVPERPEVLALRNVSHLATRIRGRLAPGFRGGALGLAARVHPTPAMAGVPLDGALAYQRDVEDFDRGRYGGPVGWFDRHGDGAWAINLRCAEVDGPRAHLFAGVGVVAGSNPAAELAETQLKLQAMLAALVRP